MKEQKYLHNYWNQFDDMNQFQEFNATLRGLRTMFMCAIYFLRDQCGYPSLQGRYIDNVEPVGGWATNMLEFNGSGPYVEVVVTSTARGRAVSDRETLKLPGCLLWDFELLDFLFSQPLTKPLTFYSFSLSFNHCSISVTLMRNAQPAPS